MNSLLALFAIPLTAAVIAGTLPSARLTRIIVPALCWLQIGIVSFVCLPVLMGDVAYIQSCSEFGVERIGALFLLLTSFVVACSLTHANSFFLREEASDAHNRNQEKTFYCCSSIFLVAMTSVFLCDNLGLLWIGIEATTLSSAALVYFSRTKHSLEATWKYLIVCSVGIAFALLGTILIFASSQHGALPHGSLNLSELTARAKSLEYPLLRLGFIFALVGYGTKAGIFPLHSWLPDAHSEAPAPASAMLSGGLLNCALFAIWKLSRLLSAAQHEALSSGLLLAMGAVTVIAASLFLVRQHGLKRLWAYSSIENVGIMLIAIGLGSGALFFLQALNHSIAKVALFLIAGNVIQATGTKKLSEIRGLLDAAPGWSVLLVLSSLCVTGVPPSGTFVSEWLILTELAERGNILIAAALLIALTVTFIAIVVHVGGLLFGTPRGTVKQFHPVATSVIPALLVVFSLACGITTLPLYLVASR